MSQKSAIQRGEVNGANGGNFQPRFHRVTEEDIATALTTLTSSIGQVPIITQGQIGDMCNVGSSSVSNWVREGTLRAVYFIQIAHESARRGDMALIQLLMPKNYSLQPSPGGNTNGDCTDEECEIVGSADRVRQHFDERNKKAAKRELDNLKKHVASMEEEINLL
jgi:hypothetical protein